MTTRVGAGLGEKSSKRDESRQKTLGKTTNDRRENCGRGVEWRVF
jgi:hypothetical protein